MHKSKELPGGMSSYRENGSNVSFDTPASTPNAILARYPFWHELGLYDAKLFITTGSFMTTGS
jgi:hypothetical protein